MTCVVGAALKGSVWIGADSAGVGGYELTVRRDRKAFVLGEYAFGFTLSFRHIQLVRHSWHPPVPPADPDLLEKHMATTVVDSLRRVLKRGGALRREHEVETGTSCLIGVRGRLFHVQPDWQVAENEVPYAACGCGESYAIGAMAAMWSSKSNRSVESAVRRALKISEQFCAGVRGPFHVVHAGGDE